MIERTESFIDVGCDHGYVVQYVYRKGLADTITACDISAPSLEKARRLIGAESGVRFVCADGAVAAAGHETVLVSGMGGEEICSVMAGCAPEWFILSPQSHVSRVRKALLQADYDIVFDRVAEDGKFYDILKAKRGGGRERLVSVSDLQLKYGIFCDRPDPVLAKRLKKMSAALDTYPKTEENVRKRQEITEVIKWQLR